LLRNSRYKLKVILWQLVQQELAFKGKYLNFVKSAIVEATSILNINTFENSDISKERNLLLYLLWHPTPKRQSPRLSHSKLSA
jgi:hypothetical protein